MMLDSASVELFGFRLRIKHQLLATRTQNDLVLLPLLYNDYFPELQVEKNRACCKLLMQNFPDTCLTDNIFNVVTMGKSRNWNAQKLAMANEWTCLGHSGQRRVVHHA